MIRSRLLLAAAFVVRLGLIACPITLTFSQTCDVAYPCGSPATRPRPVPFTVPVAGTDADVFLANQIGTSDVASIAFVVSTIAGVRSNASSFSGDGGLAIAAELYGVAGIAIGRNGVIYIADSGNNRIRQVDQSGIISTFAGTGSPNSTGDGGPAVQAGLPAPSGIATDGTGNVYVTSGGAIRKISTNGIIQTLTLGIDAMFITADSTGNVYTIGTAANTLRRISQSGVVSIVAQIPTSGSIISGLAIDPTGNLYVSQLLSIGVKPSPWFGKAEIWKVTQSGLVTLFAGSDTYGNSGDGGPATQAELFMPSGPVFDAVGNLYFSDYRTIRMISQAGIINTVYGNASSPIVGDGAPALLTAPDYSSGGPQTFDHLAVTSSGQVLFTRGNQVKILLPSASGSGCQYITVPTSTSFGANGGNASIGVITFDGCPWTSVFSWVGGSTDANWLTISGLAIKPNLNSGNGSISLTVSPNPSLAGRNGQLSVAGAIVNITQSGQPPVPPPPPEVCSFVFNPPVVSVPFTGGSGTLSMTSSYQDCKWNIVSNVPWISLGIASGVGNGTILYNVLQNDSTLVRTGALSIAGQSVTFTQAVRMPAPQITSTGNGASFLQSYAPGMLMSVFGTNLSLGAPQTNTTTPLPLTALSGTSVSINGIPAPLLYISNSQINLQIPYEVGVGTAVLTVNSNGQNTSSNLPIQAAGPGVFVDSTNGLIVPWETAPLGASIGLFVTGVGLVSPPVMTGNTPAGKSTPMPTLPVTLTVGGLTVVPDYIGMPGWSVGTLQMNFTVPSSIAPGPQPVVVTIGGVPSKPALLTVTQ